MAMWKKALVIVVASLVAVFPMVTQVAMARPLVSGLFPTEQAAQEALGAAPTVSQSSVVLPQGKELGDEELTKTDGEGLLTAVIGAALGGAYEYGQERLHGEKVNLASIALGAAYGAVTLGIGVPDAVAISAVRWTARAVAAAGTAATSLGQKIATGFSRYIAGPIIRLFTGHRR